MSSDLPIPFEDDPSLDGPPPKPNLSDRLELERIRKQRKLQFRHLKRKQKELLKEEREKRKNDRKRIAAGDQDPAPEGPAPAQ